MESASSLSTREMERCSSDSVCLLTVQAKSITSLFASSMISLSIPMAFGKLVDMAIKGDMSSLPLLTCGMAGLFGVAAILDYYSDYISDFLAHTIIQKIRNDTYKVILNEDVFLYLSSECRWSFTTRPTREN